MFWLAGRAENQRWRFERILGGLGAPAQRFVVTAWERGGESDFRGALRLLSAIWRQSQSLEGFVLPAGGSRIGVQVRDVEGQVRLLQLPESVLRAEGARVGTLLWEASSPASGLRRGRALPRGVA